MCVPISRLARFLQDTIALWALDGHVRADPDSGAVVVHGPGDAIATVEHAPPGDPFRWYVRWHDGAAAATPARVRPCGSLVGVLTALRRAFDVERGSAIRIAPASDEEDDSSPEPAPAARAGDRAEASTAADEDFRRDAIAAPSGGRVPVTVLTGFLGSGKTTLLARLLRDPAMGRTAVIVNEFGEIGLDHDLIETSDESFVQLSTGCLCCNVRSDLVRTLAELATRRASGELPPFERMMIETSGLADPAPILHALMTDRGLSTAYVLDAVVTTVDAITGAGTLDRHPESVRQVAVADTIVLTKTDLPQAAAEEVEALVRMRNADARVMRAVRGDIAPAVLFEQRLFPSPPTPTQEPARISGHSPLPSPSGRGAGGEGRDCTTAFQGASRDICVVQSLPEGEGSLELPSPSGRRVGDEGELTRHSITRRAFEAHTHTHTEGISTFCLVRAQPVHAATLALFVSALADNCGADLLRVKGIARVSERPERPAVVHGVQHVYFPPRWLARWPSSDRRTRMVFIGRRIRPAWVEALLELLDAEVAAATASKGTTTGSPA